MNQETDNKVDGFLNASQLLKIKGIGSSAWNDWQQSKIALPKIGKKCFEPSGTWLQEKQIDNALKNRKRLLEIERVDRLSQLGSAEWLPNLQKAKVTKLSGQKWENFGHQEAGQLYLIPEEALILLEMNCIELIWNGMPLSVQQAYEVLIYSEKSKCTLEEYRVYSQLIKNGYKLKRFKDKSYPDSKNHNATKRIIMNEDGFWSQNSKDSNIPKNSDNNGTHSVLNSNNQSQDLQVLNSNNNTNNNVHKPPKIEIISEEKISSNIKIIKGPNLSSNNEIHKFITFENNGKKSEDIININLTNSEAVDGNSLSCVKDKMPEILQVEPETNENNSLYSCVKDKMPEILQVELETNENNSLSSCVKNKIPEILQVEPETNENNSLSSCVKNKMPEVLQVEPEKDENSLYSCVKDKMPEILQVESETNENNSLYSCAKYKMPEIFQVEPERNDNDPLSPCIKDKMPEILQVEPETNDKNSLAIRNPARIKRLRSPAIDSSFAKKPRPEIIELSDDEIEEIPRPLTRTEILNTLPNLGIQNNKSIIVELSKKYIPQNIKPIKNIYKFDRQSLLNLPKKDIAIKTNTELDCFGHNSQTNQFYSDGSQCQTISHSLNNGYTYRGTRWQREENSYIHQNVYHNTSHNSYSGTYYQSNMNFVMEVMSNMVRSSRYPQQYQTTFCQNVHIYSQRFPYTPRYTPYSYNSYPIMPRDTYARRGSGVSNSRNRGRYNNENQKTVYDEPCQSTFTVYSGFNSWGDLKQKWKEEQTITIEDEDNPLNNIDDDNNEIEVVQESLTPLINSKNKIVNLSDVYEKLRVIKSASEKTIRSRKVDYFLSYEVYSISQHYKKANPGLPLFRVYVLNTNKDPYLDFIKLQRLQQDSKEIPIIVACVSENCISYVQLGVVILPSLT